MVRETKCRVYQVTSFSLIFKILNHWDVCFSYEHVEMEPRTLLHRCKHLTPYRCCYLSTGWLADRKGCPPGEEQSTPGSHMGTLKCLFYNNDMIFKSTEIYLWIHRDRDVNMHTKQAFAEWLGYQITFSNNISTEQCILRSIQQAQSQFKIKDKK